MSHRNESGTSIMERDVSGLLNLGLVTGEAGGTNNLKGLLTELLQAELKISHGTVEGPADFASYRQQVLDWGPFMSRILGKTALSTWMFAYLRFFLVTTRFFWP